MNNYRTGKQPSVMKHQFSQVPKAEIPRSSFDRSHGYKTTFDAGWLIPFYVDEVLPGDTFNCRVTAFARLATPIFPLMDNAYMDTQFFAVPIRLIWENWERFNGAQDNPASSTDYVVPTVTMSPGTLENTIWDYFGLPYDMDPANSGEISALPFRAYNLIWNEWYRDQNLQNSLTVPTGDGPDAVSGYALQRRGKRHDYFTSCLPWPQKGESVTIPLGSLAPVVPSNVNPTPFFTEVGGTIPKALTTNAPGNTTVQLSANAEAGPALLEWNTTGLQTDLTSATATTINQLRQSFQIQKLLERDARGGTRYTEVIRAHFGVTSPDARLQRPEFLGGGSSPIIINPVPQTAPTDATSPQGNLAAVGTVALNNHGFTKSFTEHCIIIGLVSVRADLTYQQALNRMWTRSTRYDFYWPALAHIGEQAVLNKEIHYQNNAQRDDVFGYQERFAEYRYKPSQITGRFRSANSASLDAWHLAQDFGGTVPVLNGSFIIENPPFDRVIAVPSEPHFLFDSYINLRCARPMPLYGVPGFVDRF